MAERRWTVMLIPHGEGGSKSVSISVTVFKLLVGVATVLVATLLAATIGVVSRTVDRTQSSRLARENRILTAELGKLGDKVAALSDTLALISRRDEQVRLMAGLEPLSSDVRRAGIGGPAGDWPERERLLAQGGEGGRQALLVHLDVDALLRRANLISSSLREASESLSSHVQRLSATPSIMPTAGFLTSNFTNLRYHPILHVGRPHEGIDVTAPYGTPIIAPAAGRIVAVGWRNGFGLAVEIDHGYGVRTIYAHMSRTATAVGQQVRRGDRLGYVGNTGLSTGPHLHYEVHVNGRPVDPLRYVMPNAIAD
jgi:murein DD-endopeptidase MepM/ murein hydrolase activator NlpD